MGPSSYLQNGNLHTANLISDADCRKAEETLRFQSTSGKRLSPHAEAAFPERVSTRHPCLSQCTHTAGRPSSPLHVNRFASTTSLFECDCHNLTCVDTLANRREAIKSRRNSLASTHS
ncbi:hypothetical protein TGVAND_315715 [Toxoplasma gondii VAND]|uniref:Uncharacterized protein n=1 Tax=Toxoplasma gondii VAND TaxID=933077 RepID=A0A086PNU4_TOXGO|nr:hypothetical protein TGVAND_315715 [Toxoplasma gondii VAND]